MLHQTTQWHERRGSPQQFEKYLRFFRSPMRRWPLENKDITKELAHLTERVLRCVPMRFGKCLEQLRSPTWTVPPATSTHPRTPQSQTYGKVPSMRPSATPMAEPAPPTQDPHSFWPVPRADYITHAMLKKHGLGRTGGARSAWRS